MVDTRGRRCRTVMAVAAVAGSLLLAGCSSPVHPEPLDPKSGGGGGRELTGGGAPTSESPEPSPTVPEVDVCALVSAERVAEIFATDSAPEAFEPPGSEVEGVPGVVAAYRCAYKWGDDPDNDGVTLTVVLMEPALSADQYVTGALGKGYGSVDGIGDVAGIDREKRAGYHADSLVSAKRIGDYLAGLTAIAPPDTPEKTFAELANEIFTNVGDLD